MAMRLSGMMSGMDTESIIQQLVEAKSTKLNTTKKAQIKANWKQDAWKELNTKLKNLQSKYISNMRFSEAYSKKTTKVSNSSVVSVITGKDAVNGVQALKVKQLAKTGYLTGAELKKGTGDSAVKGDYTAMTKLSELGVTGEGSFRVKSTKGSVDVKVNENTTISDVLNKLKDAGLNASFDTKTQRFFVSAKDSGVSNDFSITASNVNGGAALDALGLKVSLSQDKASLEEYKKDAAYYVPGNETATIAKMQSMIDDVVNSRTESYFKQYKTLQSNVQAAEDKIEEIGDKYKDGPDLLSVEDYANAIDDKSKEIAELVKKKAEDTTLVDADRDDIDEQIAKLREEITDLAEKKNDAVTLATQEKNLKSYKDKLMDIAGYIDVTGNAEDGYTAEASKTLKEEVAESFLERAKYAADVVADYKAEQARLAADPDAAASGSGATKVSGQDAIINLNGADFTNSTNVFEINGLTFTALSETAENETVTVTTQNDTDGIYDMIKSFLKEYNSVINEMDKLYNAASAKGYEPLLSEEKEVMSDSDVEEYEKKIKESLLRGDRTVSSVSSALKGIMSAGITVNGKKMYLSDFGISTLGYFNAPDNEKNAYHIDGDEDDADTSGNADKLKGLISSDPDTVISFFTQLSRNLHAKMTDMSSSIKGYRSFGSFYDDKKMQSDYDSYTSKINTLQQKLNDYEDKWYSKFAKMETAMAKQQKNASALSSLLGGS